MNTIGSTALGARYYFATTGRPYDENVKPVKAAAETDKKKDFPSRTISWLFPTDVYQNLEEGKLPIHPGAASEQDPFDQFLQTYWNLSVRLTEGFARPKTVLSEAVGTPPNTPSKAMKQQLRFAIAFKDPQTGLKEVAKRVWSMVENAFAFNIFHDLEAHRSFADVFKKSEFWERAVKVIKTEALFVAALGGKITTVVSSGAQSVRHLVEVCTEKIFSKKDKKKDDDRKEINEITDIKSVPHIELFRVHFYSTVRAIVGAARNVFMFIVIPPYYIVQTCQALFASDRDVEKLSNVTKKTAQESPKETPKPS